MLDLEETRSELVSGNGTENMARRVSSRHCEQKKHVLLCKMNPASHFYLFEKGEKNNK